MFTSVLPYVVDKATIIHGSIVIAGNKPVSSHKKAILAAKDEYSRACLVT